MNNAPINQKLVSLNSNKKEGVQISFEKKEVWIGLGKKATQALIPALSTWFDKMDDVLFNEAEKKSDISGNHFFETLRQLRLYRQDLEKSWVNNLNKNVDPFLYIEKEIFSPTSLFDKTKETKDSSFLSLVNNDDLEESLAIESMISRSIREYGPSYEGYQARLRKLISIENLEKNEVLKSLDLPWTPEYVVHCFQKALVEVCGETQLETSIKLLIYKHWEREVLSELNLDILSQFLQDRGFHAHQIIPSIRHRTPSHEYKEKNNLSQNNLENDILKQMNHANASNSLQEAWENTDWTKLVNLLKVYHVPVEKKTKLEKEESDLLLHALHHVSFQVRELNKEMDKYLAEDNLNDPNHKIHDKLKQGVFSSAQLKNQLQSQMKNWTGENLKIKHHDELTLDLAAWLFEYIWQDPTLPNKIQVLLARLQVPYVKAALADPGLLAEPTHAARQFLEKLVNWGQSWSPDSDPKEERLDKFKEAIDKIVENFAPNENDFEEALHWFDEKNEPIERRAKVTEKRLRENAQGQERLSEARIHVVTDLQMRLNNKFVPPLVEQFIRRPWAHYLVIIALKDGRSSSNYRQAVDWVLGVVAHFSPSTNAPIAHRFPLDKLKKQMISAQLTLGIDEKSLEKFWDFLVDKVFNIKSREGKYLSPIKSLKTNLSITQEDFKNEIVEPFKNIEEKIKEKEILEEKSLDEINSSIKTTPLIEFISPFINKSTKTQMEEWIEQKQPYVQSGVWWQWKKEDGHIQSIKLSWSGRFAKKTLFVNSQGRKAVELPWEEIDEMIKGGILLVEGIKPVTDRAFEALTEEQIKMKENNSIIKSEPQKKIIS